MKSNGTGEISSFAVFPSASEFSNSLLKMSTPKSAPPDPHDTDVLLTIPRAVSKLDECFQTSTTFTFPPKSELLETEEETRKLDFREFFSRLYRSFLVAFVFVTCLYGVFSFAVEYNDPGWDDGIGSAWIESSVNGSHTLTLVGEFRLANSSEEIGRILRNHTYGLAFAYLSNESPSNGTMRIVLSLRSEDNPQARKAPERKNTHSLSKRSLDKVIPSELEEFSTYDDDYPIRFDVKSAKTPELGAVSEENDTEPDYPELPSFNASGDPYAEKCRDYWTQFQQQQIFSAANREILNIRNKIERALPHSDIQLDVKEGEIPADVIQNRLLTQRTMFEVLKKFGGPTDRQSIPNEDDKEDAWKDFWK